MYVCITLDPNTKDVTVYERDNRSILCNVCCEVIKSWAREMAEWLRALDTLPEVLSSSPSTHIHRINKFRKMK